MLQKLSIFKGLLLGVSAIFLAVNVDLNTSEATNETDSLTENKTIFGNNTSNNTSVVSNNGPIILNVPEVGEEQYRWVNG